MPDLRLPHRFAGPVRTARLVLRTMTANDVDGRGDPRRRVQRGRAAPGQRRAGSTQREVRRALPPPGHARGGALPRGHLVQGRLGDSSIYAVLDREWAARMEYPAVVGRHAADLTGPLTRDG